MFKKLVKAIFKIHLMISLSLVFGCKPHCKTINSENDPEFSLSMQVCRDAKDVNRSSLYSTDRVKLYNVNLKSCLSELLDKDLSLIHFSEKGAEELMLTGTFEMRKPSQSQKEAKQLFLTVLQQEMNFSLRSKIPENVFRIIVVDSILLKKHLNKSEDSTNSVSSFPSKLKLKAENAGLLLIVKGLNDTYRDKVFFIADPELRGRYSFNMDGVPLEQLKTYLEKNIGLSYLPVKESENPLATTEVVFND